MKIAIHQNHEVFNHSTLWNKEWIEYCKQNKIEYGVVNCFDNNILEVLQEYDILLWHFNNYSLQDMLFARSILNSAQKMGLRVFPDFNTSWHFDDKVAETFLLNSVGAPIPKSWVFFTYKTAVSFFMNECNYPVVAKLRCGSGSNNVKLLKNNKDALKYARRMFGKGYRSAPSLLFKTKSNIRSSNNWETAIKRFKRIPDFIETLRNARKFPNEKGYIYLQEYVPNDGYDLKVVVVGDKLSFLARDVRKGDFRASGGGYINYDKALITSEIRKIAFDLSEKLGFQSMGYDFIIDKKDNTPKIVEISYGFSHTAQIGLGGYWNREDIWHEQPLNATIEILKMLLG
jgi:glutathione synthase/RimK-type ligase-like ATP-grasp enzyme